jgi:hypothetical protein
VSFGNPDFGQLIIKVYWFFLYEHTYELIGSPVVFSPGMEDEICPYATFHLLGFREEMDPASKAAAMNFQTFPHQNGGHTGTLGSPPMQANGHLHQRSGSQSMVCGFESLGVGNTGPHGWIPVSHFSSEYNFLSQK